MDRDNSMTGLVLKIERASIHDGQGLRTVLFLKGCPLRCSWCSTPESQSPLPERGYDKDRCEGCGRCILACPEGALSRVDGRDGIRRDADKCRNLFKCVDECPTGASKRYGVYMSVQDVIDEISKDEVFFFHSGGGITISGGEPLNQPRFTEAVLKECKKLGIHTAIESCLYAPWDSLSMILPWLDLLYVDMKLMDSDLHKEWTGVHNGLILENLRKIDALDLNIEIIGRVPMIPGVTDSDKNLADTARFARSIKQIKHIELLPYHRLGTGTYKHLGREYSLRDLAVPSPETVARKEKYLLRVFGE